jgi:hypothetical protein
MAGYPATPSPVLLLYTGGWPIDGLSSVTGSRLVETEPDAFKLK